MIDVLKSLNNYQNNFTLATIRRGRNFAYENKVTHITLNANTITCLSHGTKKYSTTIEVFVDGNCENYCSCPVGYDCKHTYALIHTLLNKKDDRIKALLNNLQKRLKIEENDNEDNLLSFQGKLHRNKKEKSDFTIFTEQITNKLTQKNDRAIVNKIIKKLLQLFPIIEQIISHDHDNPMNFIDNDEFMTKYYTNDFFEELLSEFPLLTPNFFFINDFTNSNIKTFSNFFYFFIHYHANYFYDKHPFIKLLIDTDQYNKIIEKAKLATAKIEWNNTLKTLATTKYNEQRTIPLQIEFAIKLSKNQTFNIHYRHSNNQKWKKLIKKDVFPLWKKHKQNKIKLLPDDIFILEFLFTKIAVENSITITLNGYNHSSELLENMHNLFFDKLFNGELKSKIIQSSQTTYNPKKIEFKLSKTATNENAIVIYQDNQPIKTISKKLEIINNNNILIFTDDNQLFYSDNKNLLDMAAFCPIVPNEVFKKSEFKKIFNTQNKKKTTDKYKIAIFFLLSITEDNNDYLHLSCSLAVTEEKPLYILNNDFNWIKQKKNNIELPDQIPGEDSVPSLISSFGFKFDEKHNNWTARLNKNYQQKFLKWYCQIPKEIHIYGTGEIKKLLNVKTIKGTAKIKATPTNINWLEIEKELSTEDTTFTQKEINLLEKADGQFIKLPKKGWAKIEMTIDEESKQNLEEMGLSWDKFKNKQKIHVLSLNNTAIFKDLQPKNMQNKLPNRALKPPKDFKAKLRPYQLIGFQFLDYLSRNSLGGILADDMGLGKTIQTLCWLKHNSIDKKKKKVLIVCPKSVMNNWQEETIKFTPSISTYPVPTGNISKPKINSIKENIIIINYSQLLNMIEELNAMSWDTIILDEAQYIKNPLSKRAKAAYSLQATHKLVLTGTPVENRYIDLWSLMEFVNPGYLSSTTEFKAMYENIDGAGKLLARRIRPFLLRRKKSEVAKDLPPRIEESINCSMDEDQQKIYDLQLAKARGLIYNIKDAKSFNKSRFELLESLLRLRQICLMPQLVSNKYKNISSVKLNELIKMTTEILSENHKILIFSQFVQTLNIIQTELNKNKIKNYILTGKTENRGELVKEFQNSEENAVFLLSLKAAGSGLNLTAADYVIIFDPWWNPAVEDQAIDRTHRIGQKNTVIAYRFVVKDSIEEKIMTLKERKKSLVTDLFDDSTFSNALTLNDFKDLLN